MEKKRPIGLTIFAVINFFFALIVSLGFMLRFLFEEIRIAVPFTPYTVLSPLITITLMVLSGIGFLKMKWGLGYVLGNIFTVGALLNIVLGWAFAGLSTSFVLHIPSMIYPLVLLLFLNLKYKDCFKTAHK